jgi:diguanylate cyclase (GGDEF)-like protein
MEIRLYLQILRRGWWIIALTTLTALTAALAVTYFVTPQYQATASFIVTPGSALVSRSDVLNGLDTLDRQSVISTYAEVMSSARIYNDALALLKVQPADLEAYTYETSVVENSSILELKVGGPYPQLAAKLANAIGSRTIDFTRQINQVFTVDFLDAAAAPIEPVSPKPLLNAGFSLALGLIIGAVLAILMEQLRIPLETVRQRLHFDEITGVYKGKYFSRLLDEELAQHPGSALSVGLVELNGIRDLTETLPIAGMQSILQKTTDILRKELRGNDVIGRWSDNSFIIMLPNTAGMAAKSIFIRIFQALSQPVRLEQLNMMIELDARIGGAEYSNDISIQELFEKVDTALEQARRAQANADPVYVWELKNPFWTQPITDGKQ